MATDRKSRLQDFVAWTAAHITGDEKGQAQIFLDRLFQAFGRKGLLEVGGQPEFRIRKSKEDGGGTAFADYVWKPHPIWTTEHSDSRIPAWLNICRRGTFYGQQLL